MPFYGVTSLSDIQMWRYHQSHYTDTGATHFYKYPILRKDSYNSAANWASAWQNNKMDVRAVKTDQPGHLPSLISLQSALNG